MSGNREVDVVGAHTPPVTSHGRHVIVAIGIDRYRHRRALANAVSDADGATRLFEQLGFVRVRPPLLDDAATGQAMNALVGDLEHRLDGDDSLVVFYAGHGATRTQQVGRDEVSTGYLLPVDAAGDDGDVTTWLELEPWLRRISRLPPRHILVILDACFSGSALALIRWGRGSGELPGLPYALANSKQSRLILASTLEDEPASDDGPRPGHSLFTGCLIEALTGGAKAVGTHEGRTITIGSEIAHYVRERVRSYPGRLGASQTPDFGTFDLDRRGEMLVPLLLDRDLEPAARTTPRSDRANGSTSVPVQVGARLRWLTLGLILVAGVMALIAWRAGWKPWGSSGATTTERAPDAAAPVAPVAPVPSARAAPMLAAPAARFCSASVVSSPKGALVSWEGTTVTAPAHLLLRCGLETTLEVRKTGYLGVTRKVTATDDTPPLNVRLRKVRATTVGASSQDTATGRLVLSLDAACRVAIDGTTEDDATTQVNMELSVGRHTLILRGEPGPKGDALDAFSVDITANATAQVARSCPRHPPAL